MPCLDIQSYLLCFSSVMSAEDRWNTESDGLLFDIDLRCNILITPSISMITFLAKITNKLRPNRLFGPETKQRQVKPTALYFIDILKLELALCLTAAVEISSCQHLRPQDCPHERTEKNVLETIHQGKYPEHGFEIRIKDYN